MHGLPDRLCSVLAPGLAAHGVESKTGYIHLQVEPCQVEACQQHWGQAQAQVARPTEEYVHIIVTRGPDRLRALWSVCMSGLMYGHSAFSGCTSVIASFVCFQAVSTDMMQPTALLSAQPMLTIVFSPRHTDTPHIKLQLHRQEHWLLASSTHHASQC